VYANTVRLSSWTSPRRECREQVLLSRKDIGGVFHKKKERLAGRQDLHSQLDSGSWSHTSPLSSKRAQRALKRQHLIFMEGRQKTVQGRFLMSKGNKVTSAVQNELL
jgi:hypothetical protein